MDNSETNNMPTLSRAARFIFVKPWLWIWRKRLPILSVLFASVTIHGLTTVIMGRKVEAKLQEIRASGDPVYPIDLKQKPVPDTENGAIELEKIFVQIKPASDSIEFGHLHANPRSWESDPNWWARVSALLKKIDGPISKVGPALGKPYVQFDVKWEDGFTALVPHYAKARALGRVLCAKSLCEAKAGHMQQAVTWAITPIELAGVFHDDKTLISQLVRIAIMNMALSTLEDVAKMGRITPEMQEHVESELSRIELNQSFANAFKGERALGTSVYVSVKSLDIDGAMPRYLYSIPWKPFLYADEIYYLNQMEKRISLLNKPYREVRNQLKQMEAELSSAPQYCWLTSFLTPSITHPIERRDITISSINGTRIVYRLAVYHNVHGVYPDKLSDLGVDIPRDVMTGKPYMYKKQGRGFLLYGVGPSLVDHGGKDYRDTQPVDRNNGDITWKFVD